MRTYKKWMGGLMLGAVLLTAAEAGTAAENTSDNVSGVISRVISTYGIVSYAAETSTIDLSQVKKVEYSSLRDLIKAGNFSYLQSVDSQNRQTAPYEKMHETLKEEYTYLKKMADSYKDDGDTEMQALYENNAKNIRTSMAQVQSTINRMNSTSQEKTMKDMADTLTATEMQVLRLICADKSNAEIGELLDIKLATVKTHVSHVLQKLGVSRRSEAKTAAQRLWMVE